MKIREIMIKGFPIDSMSRCKHYNKETDITAIKFKCCGTYYPCYECHIESADHPPAVWGADEQHEKAVLCGACGTELAIRDYKNNRSACPNCAASFNPRCELHSHLYFDS